MGELPGKSDAGQKAIIIRICPVCQTMQKLGIMCGICDAPLYPPYLIEINGKLIIRTYREIRDGR